MRQDSGTTLDAKLMLHSTVIGSNAAVELEREVKGE